MIGLAVEYFAYDDGASLFAGVELVVAAGEYVVIAGASSAGKTTLARLLAGQTGADGGSRFRGTLTLGRETIRFDGSPTDPRIDPAAWSARVGFVAQSSWGQLSMMSASVAEEIAFGPANRGMPARDMQASVAEVAAAMGLTDLLGRDPRRLSGGQLRRTVIAAAVAMRPEVLILDEPFQGLDAEAAESVVDALEGLRAGGTAVVVCEPMLPRGAPADARVLALADGRTVFTGRLTEARWAGLGRYGIGTAGEAPRITGRHTGGHTGGQGVGYDGGTARPDRTSRPREELVAFRHVGFRHPARDGAGRRSDAATRRTENPGGLPDLHGTGPDHTSRDEPVPLVLRDVDLSVAAGEIVAVRGANGSGKSTLLQHVNGLHRALSGSVVVDGVPIARQPTGELARHVGHLFQDTDQQLFERTVLREVCYGPLLTGSRRADAVRTASAALSRVGLEAYEELHPYELGFVQRRLVALASIIATGPVVWVLDEPTAGLDDPTRNLVAELILEHAAAGGAVIMATHDDTFAEAVATRTVRIERGRVLPEAGRN